MGIQDRDWYRDHTRTRDAQQTVARASKAAPTRPQGQRHHPAEYVALVAFLIAVVAAVLLGMRW